MTARRALLSSLLVALAARALPLFLAVEHYGDAPVRIEVAQRWAAAPHLFHGFKDVYQYGPLHLGLIGALVRLLGDREVAARGLSLVCGLAGVWLLFELARRYRGVPAATFAAIALGLSPLHIQASTTGASEAVFLAFLLGAILCVLDDRALPAALLLGAGSLIRYDGLLYLGLLTLLSWRRSGLLRAAAFAVLGATPMLAWFGINARYAGDALAPIHWIDYDHAQLARMALQQWGSFTYRFNCLLYWPAAVLLICTPFAGAFALAGAFRALRTRAEGWELAALAWVPAAYFTFRGAVLADFRPMTRFALVAAALSLPFAYEGLKHSRAALTACALIGVLTPASLALASYQRNGAVAEWARPLSPLSSVPPGIESAGRWLRENARPSDVVLLDAVWDYLDIPVAYQAALPDPQWIRASWTDDFEQRLARMNPTLAVLLYQGKLGDWQRDTFEFRGMKFCKVERWVYATVYRRCEQTPK